MPGAALMLALLGAVLVPSSVEAEESVFQSKPPDVYFNLTIPAVSPFFRYHGNWSDGGVEGPTTLNSGANMTFYSAGIGGYVHAHTAAGQGQAGTERQPVSMLANGRVNGTSLGDGKWVYHYDWPTMTYMFVLLDGVQPSQPVQLDSVTIETGMYTEASSWEDVYCKTESFTKNSSIFEFTGSWVFDVGVPQAWGGSVAATLPDNTSFVWVNGSTVTGSSFESNVLDITVTRGPIPLNFRQTTLNSYRSYVAEDMIVYQAPMDPKERYELTLQAPANNLIKLGTITYCSYYKGGVLPKSRAANKAALIGGLVGGLVGGPLILGIIGFVLWRCRKRRAAKRSPYAQVDPLVIDIRQPDPIVVESSPVQPATMSDKRLLGSVAIPRSSSPVPMRSDSIDPTTEYGRKLSALASGQCRDRTMSSDRTTSRDRTLSYDRTLSFDRTLSYDRNMSGPSSPSGDRAVSGDRAMSGDSKEVEPLPRRPRRPRRTRHIVEHAEDGGEVRVENGEEVVVEVLPPQYRPEWEERRNRST